jgi:hypothetical protein
MESLVTRSLFGVMNTDILLVPRVLGELSLDVIIFACQSYTSKPDAVGS